MAVYNISEKAEVDIAELYEYGIETFGFSQARSYLLQLHAHFAELAENPEIGRDASIFAPDLKRYSYKGHAIFFKTVVDGVFIVRVLGQKMDLERQFLKL